MVVCAYFVDDAREEQLIRYLNDGADKDHSSNTIFLEVVVFSC